jgi:hypothetical protein
MVLRVISLTGKVSGAGYPPPKEIISLLDEYLNSSLMGEGLRFMALREKLFRLFIQTFLFKYEFYSTIQSEYL